MKEAPRPGSEKSELRLGAWEEQYGVTAGITLRAVDYRLTGEGPVLVAPERWTSLLRDLGPGVSGLVVSRQIHGREVGVHAGAPSGVTLQTGFDAHATRSAGLVLALTVADCVPVYLIHPPTQTIALAHAGWRGTAAGVLENTIDTVLELARGRIGDIVMHCGVSICGKCFEVGSEVVEALGAHSDGPTHIDLRAVLAERARSAGLQHVTISPWCAAHDEHLFFSHRRSRGADGRMVAFLGIRLA